MSGPINQTDFARWRFPEKACAECSVAFKPNSGAHRYCDNCRTVVFKRAASSRKPRPVEKAQHYNSISNRRRLAAAGAANAAAARGITANFHDCGPDLDWMVVTQFPFSYAASKNNRFQFGKGGSRIFTKDSSRSYRDALTLHIRSELRGRKIVTGKLWLDLFVQKPDHQGDAMNVVDEVSDAIQGATGLNDRWYSLRRLDWEIKKTNPMIFIGIGQEHSDERAMCSGCGIIKPQLLFITSGKKAGQSRYCFECRTAKPEVTGRA